MSKQIFIVEIEDGADTRWIYPESFKTTMTCAIARAAKACTKGTEPGVTVIQDLSPYQRVIVKTASEK